MNTLEIKGHWNILKGTIKQKWAILTDDDLRYEDGQQDELVGRIQKRTGETREAVEAALQAGLIALAAVTASATAAVANTAEAAVAEHR